MKPTIENEVISAAVIMVSIFLVASTAIGFFAYKILKICDDEIKTDFETLKERNNEN